MTFANDLDFAKHMDEKDPLRGYREEFLFPSIGGSDAIYFAGNSLGLQPRTTGTCVLEELANGLD